MSETREFEDLLELSEVEQTQVVGGGWGDFPEIEEIDPDDLEWPVR